MNPVSPPASVRADGVQHLVPDHSALAPVELSLVVPALNEEITVGEFVDWCKEGLAEAGVTGQILIVDSSTDRTSEIVLEHGGEVLRTPKRGLGRAYIDAIPFIRGKWIVMGDADLTYDFRELKPFVEAFRGGAEFVMGSRFRGSIEEGAMPGLHRYFGTPLTTWILNRIYRSRYSDIHCGMRGITRSAMDKIDLKSQSWEYASEMVLKAARLRLAIAEVPVKFYKDRAGRVSHHKRMGWLSPWLAGWLNLKVMLVYTPDSFLLKPGFLLMGVGLLLSFALAGGPVTVGRVGFNLYWMLLGVTCATLGYSCVQIAVLARIMHRLRHGFADRVQAFLTYDRGMLLAGACGLLGFALAGALALRYATMGLRLESISHPAILGLLLIILGFQTFSFTLLLEMMQRLFPRSEMTDRAEESYGYRGLTVVDRLGVWLSQGAIRGAIPKRTDLDVLELGCGYRATQLLALGDIIRRGVGVDFKIAPELRGNDRFAFIESPIADALPGLKGDQFDLVLLISVLEHLTEPLAIIRMAHDLLKDHGTLLINVPTWTGKRLLEFSAFRLHLSPAIEMDDHKMYYGKRDLWPLLVQAGFKPSNIRLRYHKFGLNLFAVARRGSQS